MEAARLYESPSTDHAPHDPESLFTDDQVDGIVAILDVVRQHALPDATVARRPVANRVFLEKPLPQ